MQKHNPGVERYKDLEHPQLGDSTTERSSMDDSGTHTCTVNRGQGAQHVQSLIPIIRRSIHAASLFVSLQLSVLKTLHIPCVCVL